LEVTLPPLFDMHAIINVPLYQSEVDYANPMLSVFVVRFISAFADEDVIEFEIVISEAGLVYKS